MAAKKIHALPVVGKNHMIMGIVTSADLARRIEDDTPVRHVMSDHVVTVDATQPVGRAARLMREHHIHHLVVTDGGKAIGIVSSFDLLEVFEKNFN
jgi:CBS domain-containing protein